MSTPHLYLGTKNASSWALRAWLALKAAGIAFDETVVDIRRPQRFANLARIGRFSPPCAVPVLVVDGHVIFDSLAIMEYANDLAGGRLLPADPLARAAARSIMAWQHSGLSGIAARINFESAFYAPKRALTPAEVDECDRLCAHLQACIAASGGPFLFGACSLADFALAPTIIRLDRHGIDWTAWAGVQRWAEAVLGLPTVIAWLAEADQLPPIWYDIYLTSPERVPSARTAWSATV